MSGLSQPPVNYQIYNDLESKKLAIVCDIAGLDYLVSTTIGRVLRYGDPYSYGDPGLLYGGLVPIGATPGERGQKVLLDLNGSSLTIAQRLEPEQGRGAISTLSMTFIDKDKYMTQAITPGLLIPEILGAEVKIWLGYAQTSFPEDFYIVWRGRVAQVNPEIGRVSIQFTDPNLAKRQQVFYTAQTNLSGSLTNVATTVNVDANADFHKKILGPSGSYDQNVQTYLKIEDEFIEYQQTGFESTGFGTNQFLSVSRGSRGTVAVAHADNTQVDAYVQLSGRAVEMALKIMMSGWNGPYLSGYEVEAFVQTGDILNPLVFDAIVLKNNVDAVRDLGLVVGDYITITGDPNPSNNGTFIVQGFQDSLNQTNKLILVNTTFIASPLTPALLDLRSQYDVWPITCGSKLPGWEVDVAGHQYYQNTYLFNIANSYRFLINGAQSGKTFIESQIMLPVGAYCLTRQGKLSMGLTKPPIADERTISLNHTNVIEPQTIKVQRGLNNRKYFNEINWSYDYGDDGNPQSLRKTLDTDSLNSIGISSVLPITALGARTDLGFQTIVVNRERFLLQRYAQAAVMIDLKTNFGTGNQIEAGDVVVLSDAGQLQIPNMKTGERNMGQQLMEVINRSVDLKSGQVSIQLLGGLTSLIDDRFATITPSSLVTTGSTTTKVRITESFGFIFPAQEQLKWVDYVGYKISVRSLDYTTRYSEATLLAIDPSDNHALLLGSALAFTPQVGDIVDLAPYPTSTDPNDQHLPKLVHTYLDPTVAVTSGVSALSFNVAIGDAPKFNVGAKILIHNNSYSILSPEVSVLSVLGTLITVDSSLGFTPAFGQSVELIGFADFNLTEGSGGAYRFV